MAEIGIRLQPGRSVHIRLLILPLILATLSVTPAGADEFEQLSGRPWNCKSRLAQTGSLQTESSLTLTLAKSGQLVVLADMTMRDGAAEFFVRFELNGYWRISDRRLFLDVRGGQPVKAVENGAIWPEERLAKLTSTMASMIEAAVPNGVAINASTDDRLRLGEGERVIDCSRASAGA